MRISRHRKYPRIKPLPNRIFTGRKPERMNYFRMFIISMIVLLAACVFMLIGIVIGQRAIEMEEQSYYKMLCQSAEKTGGTSNVYDLSNCKLADVSYVQK